MESKFRKTWVKRVTKLHQLVIHERGGSNRQYFQESRDIAKIGYDDPVLLKICRKCFKNPT